MSRKRILLRVLPLVSIIIAACAPPPDKAAELIKGMKQLNEGMAAFFEHLKKEGVPEETEKLRKLLAQKYGLESVTVGFNDWNIRPDRPAPAEYRYIMTIFITNSKYNNESEETRKKISLELLKDTSASFRFISRVEEITVLFAYKKQFLIFKSNGPVGVYSYKKENGIWVPTRSREKQIIKIGERKIHR